MLWQKAIGSRSTKPLEIIGHTHNRATSTTSLTIGLPSGSQAGDFVFLFATTTAGFSAAMNNPSGFTERFNSGGSSPKLVLSTRVIQDPAPAGYTVTAGGSGDMNGILVVVRDAQFDLSAGVGEGSGNPIVFPSLTSSENNSILFCIPAGLNQTFTNADPDLTEIFLFNESSAQYGVFFDRVELGSTGSRSIDSTSNRSNRGLSFLVNPA